MNNKKLLPRPSTSANKPEWVKYLSQFMPRKKANEIAIDVRNKLVFKQVAEFNDKKKKNNLEILKARYPKFSRRNDELAAKAREAANNANKRIKNWIAPKAMRCKTFLGEYNEINAGRYKGSYKNYICWNYQPVYTSYYRIGLGGKKIIYVFGFETLEKKAISAPRGMIFERDGNGLLLRRLTDKMDFHPSTEDLLSKNFATVIRRKMAENYSARMAQRKSEKLAKIAAEKSKKITEQLEKLFQRDLSTTMVTLHDSRKAGNCIEGSLQFAERRLNISRDEIIKGGFLFKVPAYKLVKTGEQRALAAVKVAWNRETMVCI